MAVLFLWRPTDQSAIYGVAVGAVSTSPAPTECDNAEAVKGGSCNSPHEPCRPGSGVFNAGPAADVETCEGLCEKQTWGCEALQVRAQRPLFTQTTVRIPPITHGASAPPIACTLVRLGRTGFRSSAELDGTALAENGRETLAGESGRKLGGGWGHTGRGLGPYWSGPGRGVAVNNSAPPSPPSVHPPTVPLQRAQL